MVAIPTVNHDKSGRLATLGPPSLGISGGVGDTYRESSACISEIGVSGQRGSEGRRNTTVHVPTARPSTPEEISHARTAQTRPDCSQTRQSDWRHERPASRP